MWEAADGSGESGFGDQSSDPPLDCYILRGEILNLPEDPLLMDPKGTITAPALESFTGAIPRDGCEHGAMGSSSQGHQFQSPTSGFKK